MIRYGVLIKNYENPESGRYAPPEICDADYRPQWGIEPEERFTICTSHVERNNLTIRTLIKRFTRLSLGFSKKLPNLQAAVAMHVAHYNFCWRLRRPGKSGKFTPPPAMRAGIVDTLWTINDLYDAAMAC